MEGSRGEDGERIEPQSEIVETVAEGEEEKSAESGSMEERVGSPSEICETSAEGGEKDGPQSEIAATAMEGGKEKDAESGSMEEQIGPQSEIREFGEIAAEGGDETNAENGSMEERIPRHIATSGTSEESSSASTTTTRLEGRESDIAMVVKMVKAVEQDASAVANSLTSLFSSLQSALSEVTGSSIEHMRCHSEAAGLLQDASIDAANKGQRFINACLRLNEEMKSMGSLAAQLKTLRRVVDQFEYHASKSLPRL